MVVRISKYIVMLYFSIILTKSLFL